MMREVPPPPLADFKTMAQRHPIDAATQDELYAFAKSKGVEGINWQTPALLLRKILREKGMTDITLHRRVMGRTIEDEIVTGEAEAVREISADELLAQQVATQRPLDPRPASSLTDMDIRGLRTLAKSAGVKLARTDTAATMRQKIAEAGRVQNAP